MPSLSTPLYIRERCTRGIHYCGARHGCTGCLSKYPCRAPSVRTRINIGRMQAWGSWCGACDKQGLQLAYRSTAATKLSASHQQRRAIIADRMSGHLLSAPGLPPRVRQKQSSLVMGCAFTVLTLNPTDSRLLTWSQIGSQHEQGVLDEVVAGLHSCTWVLSTESGVTCSNRDDLRVEVFPVPLCIMRMNI
jgi:hypothetical protein